MILFTKVAATIALMIITALTGTQQNYDYLLQRIDLKLNSSIRAIVVMNDSTVWFSGSNGIYGFTEDDGKHWHIDSLQIDALKPDFRLLAVLNSKTELMMNAGSPAYILKSMDKGKTWRTIYKNNDLNIFFDSMKFSDEKNGIVAGDPIHGCFTIIETHDGGETWKQIDCNLLPKSLDGEACFASSNTSISFFKKNIWIATGGIHARILHSGDEGKHWNVYETPIQQGNQLTGIFSLDFYDEKTGIIAGGNYKAKQDANHTKAITHDGGQTWSLIADGENPAFGSCVQFQPGSKAKIILMAALPGIFISDDEGKNWIEVKDDSGKSIAENYYTFRFSPTGKVAWFAGANGKIAKLTLMK